MSRTHNAGIVTAYGAAVRGGYTGTYEEFCAQQAQYAENARQMEQAVSDVRQIKTSVESAVSEAEGYANNANQSATNASNSATQASESASNASQSANNASFSADSASQSASSAQTSANNASTSEQNAQQAAEDAQDILESVQTEGDTQIGRVQAKGDEVIELIPSDYTQMQSDIQNMSVDIANNEVDILKAFPTDSATGTIVSFNDGADDIPVKNLTVNIKPIQDLHGYDRPWIAGGGKNLLDPSLLKDQSGWNIIEIYASEGTVLTASTSTPSGKGLLAYFRQPGDAQGTANGVVTAAQHNAVTQTVGSDGYVEFVQRRSDGTYSFQNYNWQIEKGSEATDYEPYENICPISGWTGAKVTHVGKNLFDESKLLLASGWTVTNGVYSGSNSALHTAFLGGLPNLKFKPNTQYTVSLKFRSAQESKLTVLSIVYTDDTKTGQYLQGTSEYTVSLTSTSGKSVKRITLSYGGSDTVYIYDMQVEEGSTATDYEPYKGQSYAVDWTDEAGTVYGGSLDVSTGVLTVTHGVKSFNGGFIKHGSLSNGYYINNGFSDCGEGVPLCNMLLHANKTFNNLSNGQFNIDTNYTRLYFKSSAFSNATEANAFFAENPLIVAYPLATPIVYQLTPQEVKTLFGENNIFADTGDVSVEYRADIKKYIDKVVATAVSALS